MTINQLALELEELIKEESKRLFGDVSYPYVSGFFLATVKDLASSLNPRKALEEAVENLKRSSL